MADVSRHYYQWKLPDGQIKFKTTFGASLTILLTLLVLTYSLNEFIVFWERTNYTILESNTGNVYMDDVFSMTNKDGGFVVAAAFVANNDMFPDPEIGELKFILKNWGSSTDDLDFKTLEERKCTE